jgi:shikimate kinase/3-dehydroquinate synthase
VGTASGAHALNRHLALVGFMGAGKSTLGSDVAERLGRPFIDLDRDLEQDLGTTIPEFFDARGEAEFRLQEERHAIAALRLPDPAVIALGGGAVQTATIRNELRDRAFTVLLEVDPDTAWQRSAGQGRPLARDESEFRALYERRREVYEAVGEARASDTDGVVLAAAGVEVHAGALERLASLVPGGGGVALVCDPHVGGIHGAAAQVALGPRLVSVHEIPQGEAAKTASVAERLWGELRLDRDGMLVAVGGGSTTDVVGFVAATYLRGVDWVPVPTTLVGQVDAAVGGKTAIDLPQGKNLVGAFHWPSRAVVDPATLETLPEPERREGMAEVVKTGLLAGEPLWELPPPELVRRCAAFKAGVCLRDPHDEGERVILNLGHTFAHALEAAAGYDGVTHGQAVALGLLAALRLSGRATGVVEDVLAPRPVRVDRERAWAALRRDKKARAGELRLVLLGEEGPIVEARPEPEVRAALDELIAK